MEKIVIKLLDNPDMPKLKLKYVGAIEYATPKLGKDGKIKTGLDELAYDILSIEDKKTREKVQKEIVKEREELEKLLNLELGSNSSFWDKFNIPMSDEEIYLDPANPMDRLKERFLIANAYAAPSIESISEDEKYMNCIFYLHREVEEVSKKVAKKKVQDKAKAKLFNLNEENPAKLKTIASYLFGFNAQTDLTPEKAYEMISDYIEVVDLKQQKKNIDAFLEAVDKTPEEMQTKLILDKAIKKRIITSKQNIYRRGDTILGNSYDDALSYLNSVEGNSELRSLLKEVS